jgi:hypothetical protein
VFVCVWALAPVGFVLLCFSGLRGKIRISDRGMCTSSLRLCVVVWFMPPVVFAQFQLRFERVSVPALYVLRSIFRTEPLSSIGRNVRKKIDHLFVHCPRATGHSADGESAFQLHAWGDQ